MKSLVEGLRTLLILGRVSNLLTVWSNLVAGWILAESGSETFARLGVLIAGGSSLYIGGMFLNDYCDATFDARYCPQRPIPSGKISRTAVGWIAGLWFMIGLACLALLGIATTAMALLLVAAILLYDFHHKNVPWAPLIMGLCRALLYMVAFAAVRGFDVVLQARYFWPQFLLAGTLGFYVAGITYFARGESRPKKPTRWALGLVFMPVLVQFGLHLAFPSPIPFSSYFQAWPWEFWFPWYLWEESWIPYCLLFLGWISWLLVPFWRGKKTSVRRLVSGMLAGIILVDMIAVAPVLGGQAPLLLLLFPVALLLQRIIPAT